MTVKTEKGIPERNAENGESPERQENPRFFRKKLDSARVLDILVTQI